MTKPTEPPRTHHPAMMKDEAGARTGRPASALVPALSRRAWLICAILALVAAAIPALALALQQHPAPGTHRLELVVTGRRNLASLSNEIWLLGFYQPDGTPVPQAELTLHGPWQIHDGVLAAGSQGASLRWEGALAGDAKLRFLAHSWSGIVRIDWDDSSQTIDLYADPKTERELMLPITPPYAEDTRPAAYRLLAAGASALLSGLLTFLAAGWLMAYAGRLFARAGATGPRVARLFLRYGLAGAGVALALIPLALALAPWMHAATVPVRLKLAAPGRTPIDLCWDAQASACLPLIPYLDPDFQNAQLWLADLPPLPAYRLTLVFRAPLQDATLHSLALIDVQQNVPFYERTIAGSPGWFTTEGIAVEPRGEGVALRADANGKLIIADAVSLYYRITPADIVRFWLALAALCLFGGVILALLLSARAVCLPATPPTRRGIWVLWLAFVLALAGQMLLIRNAPVLFATGDSTSYLTKAIALAERSTYDTGGYEFELNRLPGYPLLLAGVIKLFGYHLSIIALCQGALFSLAVLALALALRRWMHPLLGALGILAAILSPVQVWSARALLSESAFATCATLALACLFEHLGTTGRRSGAWLLLFAILATYATFMRPNGIVLLAAPIAIWLPRGLGRWSQSGSFSAKISATARSTMPYLLAAALLPMALLAWSARNYVSRSFFGPTDMTGVSTVSGLMESGVFQPQSVVDKKIYASYLTWKYLNQNAYHGWHLRQPLFLQLSAGGRQPSNATIAQLDRALLEITARSNALSPWQLRAAALLRVAGWALFWPDTRTFANDIMKYRYEQFQNDMDSAALRQELAGSSPKLIYEEMGENRIFSLYKPFARRYYDFYFPLLLLNLIIFLALLWRGHVAFTALFLVFLANMALNVSLLNVFSRYIQIFDVFLIFHVLIGISLLARRAGSDSTSRKGLSTA